MKNRVKKIVFSCANVFLACIMLFSTACSSFLEDDNINTPPNNESIVPGGPNDEKGDENIGDNETSDSLDPDTPLNPNDPSHPNNPDEPKDPSDPIMPSDPVEPDEPGIPVVPDEPEEPEEPVYDYALNKRKDFIYRLIYQDLSQDYDTFVGAVTLETSNDIEPVEIYGITYVDYEDGYIGTEGKVYFSSGFLRFPDSDETASSHLKSGMEIVSVEESVDDFFSYVYAYESSDFYGHCVIDNKYVKYGVVDDVIQYEEQPYMFGMSVDSDRGNIYNYDIDDFVYIVEEIDYVPVVGTSLLGGADYQDIINEVNRILETQNANLTYVQLETYVAQSKDAFYSYLLGLQEETFLGIPTAELIKMTKDLSPMQHLRIGLSANGTPSIEIIEITKIASLQEKIITSIICAYGVVAGVALTAIGNIYAPLKVVLGAAGGALIGASMEAFFQVVINNTPVSDVQWAQVAVAAVAGAVSGAIGVKMAGIQNVAIREVTDTLCDAVIGGTEFFVNSLIAGESFEDACKSFGYGVVAGLVISGGVKIAVALIKGAVKWIAKGASKVLSNINGNQVRKLISGAVDDGVDELQQKAIEKAARKNARIVVDGAMNYFDDSGNLYRVGQNLLPDNTFTKNGYNYVTDSMGRKIKVSGCLKLDTAPRKTINETIQSIGKGSELLSDHRGHLIADMFGGSNGAENLIPMDSKLNLVDYKKLEGAWAKALRAGKEVFVEINPIYQGTSFRPSTIKVNYKIDGIIQKGIPFSNF